MKKMLKFLMIFSIVLMCKSSNVFGICNTENQFNNNFSTFKYKVDLNGNGGTFSKTETSVSNGKINLPTPTRAGYSFNGYSTSKDGTVDFNVSNVNIYSISSKTLYAKWNITTYKISYDLGNGILNDVVSEYNVEKEFTLGTPTKNGYTFTGWTGTGLTSVTKTVKIPKGSTGDRSYKANWTPTSYSITYNLNGGTISGQKTSYNIENDSFNLVTPTKNGYTFTGWTGTGLSTATKTVTISKGSTGNKSYTANWTPTNYTITYNTNGGTISGQKTAFTVESESFNLVTPTKNGYTFTGWTGTGLSTATKTVTISKGSTGNKSYTANWTPTSYSITYNLNSGTISGQKTSYNIESNAFNLPTPTRTGYTFTGWSGTGITGTSKTVTVNKGSTGNRSYTANWVDDIKPDIYNAWITSGPYYEVIDGRYGYTVNVQISCGDSGSGINRVLTYYENSNGWVGETNITGTMTDSFWFIPGYRKIKFVVYDNAGNSSETIIAVQCG